MGRGRPGHLAAPRAGELIKAKAQIDVVAVPYRGSGVMLSDLLGGQVTLGVDTVSAAISYVRSGQLKALAVTSAKRVPQLPDVPTVAERADSRASRPSAGPASCCRCTRPRPWSRPPSRASAA